MELDKLVLDAIRSKYQHDMKSAVAVISRYIKNDPLGSSSKTPNLISDIDKQISKFMMAKEKATYFEAIIKNLKSNDEKEK